MGTYETRVRFISETNVNVANNTSYVTVALEFRRTDYSYWGMSSDSTSFWSITCNGSYSGNKYFNFNWNIPQWQWKEVGRYSCYVTHDSDGKKSISMNGMIYFGNGVSPGTLYGSGTATLTTIPRAPSVDSISCSTEYTTGKFTIKYTPKTDIFYYKARISIPYVYTICTNALGKKNATQQTYEYSFTSDQLNKINEYASKTSEYVNISVVIESYSDSSYNSKICETSEPYTTVKLPATVKPSVSISVSESVSDIASKFGCYVKNKSKLNVSLSTTTSYGSGITSYNSTLGSYSYSNSSFTTNTLTESGTLTSTVIDGRGRNGTDSKTINVVDYFNPTCVISSVYRCDSSGNVKDDGTYLKFTYSYNIAPINNKNTKVIKLQYNNNGTWKDLTTSTAYSATNATFITPSLFNVDLSYVVRLYVADYFTSSSSTKDIPTSFSLMNMNKSGKGIAFGGVSGKDCVQSFMDVEIVDSGEKRNQIKKTVNGHSWVAGRDRALIRTYNSSTGEIFCPMSSIKTKNGTWEMGALGNQDNLYFSYVTDDNYNNSKNSSYYIRFDPSLGIKINGAPETYIAAEGTSGIWTYRKWSNGVAECWGRTTLAISGFTNTWGSVYNTLIPCISYPFTFSSVPREFVSTRSSINACWLYTEATYGGIYGENTTTKTANYGVARPTSSNQAQTITIDYYIVGRWK